MASNNFNRLIIMSATLLGLAACDQAVMANKSARYLIKGDPHSALYPIEVKRDGEDVRIVLHDAAPVPAIFSVDALGRAVAFHFTIKGTALIVPGKFDHLQLRHEGTGAVDIVVDARGK